MILFSSKAAAVQLADKMCPDAGTRYQRQQIAHPMLLQQRTQGLVRFYELVCQACPTSFLPPNA